MEDFMKKIVSTLLLLSNISLTFCYYDIDALFNEMEKEFHKNAERLNHFIILNKDDLNKGIKQTKEVADKIQSRIASYKNHSLLVKIKEDPEKKEYIIEAPAPGFRKGEVSATLEEINNQVKLTITAETKNEKKEEVTKSENGSKESEIRSSFASSSLVRSLMLPSTIDINNYKVSHEDGVFKLIFAIKPESICKKIEITLDEKTESSVKKEALQ